MDKTIPLILILLLIVIILTAKSAWTVYKEENEKDQD